RQELHPERQARLSRRNGVRSTSATGGRSVSKCAAQWSSREQRLADCVEYDSGSHCDQRERKENLQNPTATVGVCAEKQFDPVSGESAEQDARSDRGQSKPCRKALDFAHGTIQSSAAARHSIAILVTSPRFPVGIPDSQHFTPNSPSLCALFLGSCPKSVIGVEGLSIQGVPVRGVLRSTLMRHPSGAWLGGRRRCQTCRHWA